MKKDDNLRYVMVFGQCDQVSALSDAINKHWVSRGDEPISAGLTIPSNESMDGAAKYLAAHPSNRLVVLCFKSTDNSELLKQLQWFNRMDQKIILLISQKCLKRKPSHNPSREQSELGVVAVFDVKEEFVNRKLALYVDKYLEALQETPSEMKDTPHPPTRKDSPMTTPVTNTHTAPPAAPVSSPDFVTSSLALLDDTATRLKAYQEQGAVLQSQLKNLREINERSSGLIAAIEAAFGGTAAVPAAALPPAPKAAAAAPKKARRPKSTKGTRKARVTTPPKEFVLAKGRTVTIAGAAPQLILEKLLAKAPEEGATFGVSEFTQAFGAAASTFYNSLRVLRTQLTEQLGAELAARCFFNVNGQGYRWDSSPLNQTSPS